MEGLLRPKSGGDILDAVFKLRKGEGAGGTPETKDATAKGSAGRWQWDSLYKLASEGASGRRRVDPNKLRALLTTYGSFPEKHRMLIWKYLLRLPENAEAFAALMAKGTHPAYANLASKYPLRSESLLKRLRVRMGRGWGRGVRG